MIVSGAVDEAAVKARAHFRERQASGLVGEATDDVEDDDAGFPEADPEADPETDDSMETERSLSELHLLITGRRFYTEGPPEGWSLGCCCVRF